MKILFTGGGTAGHIMPLVAVAREIRKIYPKGDLKFSYLGPKDNFGSLLLSQEGIKIKGIFAGKIRRYFSPKTFFQNIFDVLFKIPLGIIQSFFYIFFSAPDIIFSKGGYGALPATISGWLLRVPIFLQESDIIPGQTNRFLSKFAMEIFVSFPVKKIEHLPKNKMIFAGNPTRRELLEGSQKEAKEFFKLTLEKPVVLILGGSQGSQRINYMLLEILPELLSDFEIIHQCGEKNQKQVKTESKIMIKGEMEKYYHLVPFLKERELKLAYAAAQAVVSRAGANSIFEIAAKGLPSILIPLLESAQNHQFKNAYAYSENGACLVIEESNLTPHFFLEKLRFLVFRPGEMKKMQKSAVEFSTPYAGKIIAEYIVNYLS
ncbi:MAG: UDP-N-acetylglucosamine--N-acetylmuramyl-(pentapeptide) pyrophosphoryl-undecaprenol N-acetylglucosamine transferase [Patescibacteria group bacterium]